jgi:hypothetical protein
MDDRPTPPRRGPGPDRDPGLRPALPSGRREPDAVEKGLRFGCGVLLGAVFGAATLGRIFWGRSIFGWEAGAWALVGAVALTCGLLGMRYGDRFFLRFAGIFRHWRRWR